MQRRQKLRIQYYYSLVYADAAIEHLRVYTLEFTFWVGSYMSVSSVFFLLYYVPLPLNSALEPGDRSFARALHFLFFVLFRPAYGRERL